MAALSRCFPKNVVAAGINREYYMSGTVFACTTEHLRATGELMCDNWPAVIVEGYETIDINNIDDFHFAEHLISSRAVIT